MHPPEFSINRVDAVYHYNMIKIMLVWNSIIAQ
jgi:hypothetical protein